MAPIPSSIDPAALRSPLDAAHARLERTAFSSALWNRRVDVWSSDRSTQDTIANRLGWLSALDVVEPHVDAVTSFAARVRGEGFSDVVLLGMGGSSLGPEVMRQVLGVSPGFPRFRMLDSVNPQEVRDAMSRAATSLFVVASKSGSTIEPNVMAAEARRRVEEAGHRPWGSRFVAITDPESPLHERARRDRFREIFVNPPDIGGRYSALSLFGLVPAALMGAPLERLFQHARAMEQACREPDSRLNPGLALGALLAAGFDAGRDKLTLILPPKLASFGLWVEQLVAESTGKHGKGIVPITGEPPARATGADRLAVVMTLGDSAADDAGDGAADATAVARLRESGTPLAMLHVPEEAALGAEFLRWEIATATAGFLMDINPFDEPNVQEAKDATRALLSSFMSTGSLPTPTSHGRLEAASFSLSRDAVRALNAPDPLQFLNVIRSGDYLGVLAYFPPSDATLAAILERFRLDAGQQAGVATMFGFGPRYLHSTGQLHKGGPPNGVFVIISAAPHQDLAVPGEPYSFGVLEAAQAFGDFASLDRAERRALLIRVGDSSPAMIESTLRALLHAENLE